MSMIFFTYRGQTQARKGEKLLRELGIPAKVQKTPGELAQNGCGYGILVPEPQGKAAAKHLREHGLEFEKSYRFSGRNRQVVSL